MKNLFSQIPSVDSVLSEKSISKLVKNFGSSLVKNAVRQAVSEVREEIKEGKITSAIKDRVFELIPLILEKETEFSLKRVINGTGIVIHTNLGRAVLSPDIMDYVKTIATSYNNLEYDLEKGKRGHRDIHAERLLAKFFNVESACVVNNNAAAVMLIINTFAEGKEVVVSRGELIEIGGSFRIPEIMKKAGARLVEVGTTNKTRLEDYKNAINENTGLVLKVHPSNYRITGFTESVSAEKIAKLCREKGVVFAEDMGSGNIYHLTSLKIYDEPVVSESVKAGIDIISFSGDKLFGCVQSGIIIGKREFIEKIRKNHLLRALRVDKITYAAIEYHLLKLMKGEYGGIPVYDMIFSSKEDIKNKIDNFLNLFEKKIDCLEIVETKSKIGGGTTPEKELDSYALAVKCKPAEKVEQFFRKRKIPVLGRITNDCFILDFRTIFEKDFPYLKEYIRELLSS